MLMELNRFGYGGIWIIRRIQSVVWGFSVAGFSVGVESMWYSKMRELIGIVDDY